VDLQIADSQKMFSYSNDLYQLLELIFKEGVVYNVKAAFGAELGNQ